MKSGGEIKLDWESFKSAIAILFERFSALDFQFYDDKITYTIEGDQYTYTLEEFNTLSLRLTEYHIFPISICTSSEIETFIEPCGSGYGYRFVDDELNVSDSAVSYKISQPSAELMLAFLSSIQEGTIRKYRRMMSSSMMTSRFLVNESGEADLFYILSRITRAVLSLKIRTEDVESEATLHQYENSFLFTLAYNTDYTYKTIHSLTELEAGRGRAVRRHYMRTADLEVPKLFYAPELIEQYNRALSSDDSFVQFIAYYHIMEYFFDDVYSNELIKSVRGILLHPGFSAKKPKEISKIINTIQQKTRASKDEFQGTELEALELTIKTFVSLAQLKDSLNEWDSSLIEYYQQHEISFSKGDVIDLNDFTNEKLPKKIAARIYKTRNALVHHKSNNTRIKERGIYHPFRDDKELSKEMPLMRLIAEAIVIAAAEEI